jgi:hypothetical protein
MLTMDKDRDPIAWSGFSAQEIQRRRMVFWMLYMTDAGEVSMCESEHEFGAHPLSLVESRYWTTSELSVGAALHRHRGS